MKTKNKRRTICRGLFVMLFSICSSIAFGQTQLRYQYEAGSSAQQQFVQQSDVSVAVADQKITSSLSHTIRWRVNVSDVSDESSAAISRTIEGVKIAISAPGLQSVEYDTDSAESEEASQLLDSIKAMVGLEVKYDSDAIGRITNLAVDKSALDKISSSIVNGAAVVNESSLTKMGKGATIVLPAKPVQQGDSWKQVFAFDTTALPASMALEFTYKGNTERDGKQLEVLDIKPRLTIQNDGKTARGKVSIRKQQGQGTLLFDNYKGSIHELSFETVVETEAVIGQNTVAQTVSTKVTLSNSRPE